MSIRLLFIISSLGYTCIFSQPVLTDYQETGNKIILDIKLNSVPLLTTDQKNKSFIHSGYFDESSPGEIPLPQRSIFIGIPENASVSLYYKILKENSYHSLSGINPEVKLINDSVLSYNYFPSKLIKSEIKAGIKLKGYLWIDNIYSIHLEINQYYFDYESASMKEIEDIHLELELNKSIISTENSIIKKRYNTGRSVLLNYDEAQKYSVSNPQIILSDTTGNWIDYTKNYVKMKVAEDGIYRVTYNDMLKAGANIAGIDPKTINIYSKGSKIPIYILGEADHSFDLEDYIEFVGRRNSGKNYREVSLPGETYNEYLGRYTDTSSYWITWNDLVPYRVSEVNNSSLLVTSDTLKYYNQVAHFEKNVFIDYPTPDLVKAQFPFWLENKFWGWYAFGVGTRDNTANVDNIFPNRGVKLFAKVVSYASNILSNAHLLSLSLVNQTLGFDTISLNKYQQKVLSTSINSDLLSEGNNNIVLKSYLTDNTYNGVYLDWYEIEYPRFLVINNDSLIFNFNYLSTTGIHNIDLLNASGSSYSIWKQGIELYEKYNDYFLSNGGIIIKDTITSTDTFFVFSDNSVKHPLIENEKSFVNLRDAAKQADYLILTNSELLSKANEYKQFVEQQYNVTTKLINVNDIYDEFAYGYFNPESIKDFLESTHSYWQGPFPQYLFIIGDANYDYYNWKHIYTGAPLVKDIVPSFGEPVSDNWFVTWDTTGAYIPQMNIGRIPVHTEQELDSYLQRHQEYLTQPYNDWNKSYLFFSGGLTDINELAILRQTNQSVIDNYVEPAPIGGNYYHFYKTLDPVTNFGPYTHEYVQDAIDLGGLFISYLGHSGTQTWDNSISDPSQLQNVNNRKPLITDFGCSTAKFAEPDVISFSELFVNSSSGQAIAYIGNSSLGFTSTSTIFPGIFYRKILQDSVLNISEAHKLAKLELLQDYGSSSAYKLFALTNELIGDPIISLPIPQKPNLVINGSGIGIQSNLTDLEDKADISVTFYNWGKAVADSFLITVQDNYLDNIVYNDSVYKLLPLYQDSLTLLIPILYKPGEHSILISIDANDNIDEIIESDNTVIFKFYVSSSRIKTLLSYNEENGIKDSLIIINPSTKSISDSIEIELSQNKDYISSYHFFIKMDSVVSHFNLPNEFQNKRIWLRGKIRGDIFYGFDKSVYAAVPMKYFLADSVSFGNSQLFNLSFYDNAINLDTSKTEFRVISAGFNDGKTAVIEMNGENFVPGGNTIGHHVCVFKDSTYEFLVYRKFDVYNNIEDRTAYAAFLDSLSANVIILIAISDEGRVDNTLKAKLHEFGSIYIDSLVFRSSWAFIGKRGAVLGSMPEAYSKPFEGRVEIDTLIQRLFTSGTLTTSNIGPSSKWESVYINQFVPQDAETNILTIGIKLDASQDTLGFLSVQNGVADLSDIDAAIYPNIKLLIGMQTNNQSQIPSISSIGVNYKGLSELATNYQVVSIDNDTIPVGGNVTLSFWVYNVGEANADSFYIKVDVVNQNNSSSTVFNQLIPSLSANSKQKFDVSYQAFGTDTEKRFLINIDPDQKVNEYFKDNNFFTRSIYIEPDLIQPTVKITFDKAEVINGDFVSKNPNIKIALSDESQIPIVDTLALKIYLNEKPVYYSGNSSILSYNISSTNPKFIAEYKPELEDGDYLLRVVAKDPNGNIADSASSEVYFVVSSETKLMQVYNYPNPFSNETYFTFRLSQIPEEIKIRIYTIAGRMIKEIIKHSTDLNYDLNKIYWNGKDEDGDVIANGTYLYKMIMKNNDKIESIIQKLVIVK